MTGTRLYLLVEGQTEETFVNELLVPTYAAQGLFIIPIIVRTSPGHRGGMRGYGKVRHQLEKLCRQDASAQVSTMFDLYALPTDFPGRGDADFPAQGSGRQKSQFLERKLAEDLGEANFIPFLMVHEFEALLFVAPERFGEWSDEAETVVRGLRAIAAAHDSPEDINDGPTTAPSKRIKAIMPRYEKPFHGPLIASDIGLAALRAACPHFSDWLTRLETFAA